MSDDYHVLRNIDGRPLICGFLKVRNEIIREGNLYRVLRNMDHYCDAAVVCDDASTDGTREHLEAWVAERNKERPGRYVLVVTDPSDQEFRKELGVKQHMLDEVHKIKPHFVLWMDGDEAFDKSGTENLRIFAAANLDTPYKAFSFHYTQFWVTTHFARTDGGFDDGWFIKLWRWSPDLVFDVVDGTHHAQFPRQVMQAFQRGLAAKAPFEQLHYGNFGHNLRWKVIQYRGGRGGWERHLVFWNGTFRPVDPSIIPDDCEKSALTANPAIDCPVPFSPAFEQRIRDLYDLRDMKEWFTVVVPAFNRADTLPRALASLKAQSYEKWVALVLDDGSTDTTYQVMREEYDPRIFYARYPYNRGGVAMNEIGMRMACEMTEWWSRLGSDDFWGPDKLALDRIGLIEHEAVYGAFQVHRDGKLEEICNPPAPAALLRKALLTSGFAASWANCAVRTSVLKRVLAKYGTFCDPRLKNMEDFLVNARIARETDGWHWRGMCDGTAVVDPDMEQTRRIMERYASRSYTFEAAWNCVTTGASGNTFQYVKDEGTTRRLIMEENIKFGREEAAK